MLIKFFVGLFIILCSPIIVYGCDFDQQVEEIERKIKASKQILDKQSLDDPEIVKHHLNLMYMVDQEARKLYNNFNNPTSRKILEEVDCFHIEYLKAILEIYDWITISKFGKEADNQKKWKHLDQTSRDGVEEIIQATPPLALFPQARFFLCCFTLWVDILEPIYRTKESEVAPALTGFLERFRRQRSSTSQSSPAAAAEADKNSTSRDSTDSSDQSPRSAPET